MSDDDGRYNNNANLWRKTYGYVRRKPTTAVFFDENLAISRSLDLNETYRHRDLFEVEGYNHPGPEANWLINIPPGYKFEEGLIYFNNECEKSASFYSTFPVLPYVIYFTIPNADNSHNVNVFGTSIPTLDEMFIGTSAPFTGYVRYIAISGLSWPQGFFGNPDSVWAGEVDLNNVSSFTASYTLPAGGSDYLYYDTIHENFNSFTANTNTLNDTKNNTEATNTLSADTTNKLHFIIFRIV